MTLKVVARVASWLNLGKKQLKQEWDVGDFLNLLG